MYRKRNTAVFIDGENVAAKNAALILSIIRSKGRIDSAKVYGIQKDQSTRKWAEVASVTKDMKDIRLCGGSARNKVDRKIKLDTLKNVKSSPNIDIVVIVSSDQGYAGNVKQLRKMGKHVIVIGEKKTPESLRKAGNEFVMI